MRAFVEEFARRQAELDQTAEQLRAKRDEAVRIAYREGLPMRDIARTVGMSHQRVSQIVRS